MCEDPTTFGESCTTAMPASSLSLFRTTGFSAVLPSGLPNANKGLPEFVTGVACNTGWATRLPPGDSLTKFAEVSSHVPVSLK